MAEKQLTEAAWKTFSKGKSYKDAAFIKALGELAKSEKDSPAEQLEALEELEKQSEALSRAHRGDKALAEYLGDVERALQRQRKSTEKAAKEAADAKSDDEEADAPELLTTKMIPLVRQLKKGDIMQVLLATAGKQTALLMMRKPIANSRRKLLTEYLGTSSGVKYIKGEAGLPDGETTVLFDLESSAGAGMAKRVRQAILDQTGQRLKLRCRAADSGEEEEDGDDEDEGGDGERAGREQANPLEAGFRKRWAALEPKLLAALKAQQGDVSRLRAVGAFATEKAGSGDYAAATRSLDMLEKLLAPGSGEEVPKAPPEPTQGPDPAAAFNARLAALMPKVKQALTAGGEGAQDIKLKVSEAGVLARKKDFERAGALLDEAEELLGAPRSTGNETESPESEQEDGDAALQAEVDALLARLQPGFERASTATLNPQAAALFKPISTAWEMAQESIDAGRLDRALTILQRLADGGALTRLLQALDAPQGQDSGRLVRQRQFLLQRWARIPGELRAELQGLRRIIESSTADEDPGGLVDDIAENLEDLLDDMQDMIDEAINSGSTKGLEGARQRAQQDPLVRHLRNSPGFDGGKLLRAILDAVGEVEAEMTA